VKYTVTKSVYLFFILRHADFLKEVPFGVVDISEKKFTGHIRPKKLKKFLTIAQT
jgi:hypothetical protein